MEYWHQIMSMTIIIMVGFLLNMISRKKYMKCKSLKTNPTNNNFKKQLEIDAGVTIPITQFDIYSINNLGTTTTATIFEFTANEENQFESFKSLIQNKVYSIIEANPWLAGRVILSENNDQPILWFPKQNKQQFKALQAQCFSIEEIMSSSNNLEKEIIMVKNTKQMICQSILDQDQTLWKVSLLFLTTSKQKPQNKFALIVSMAHVLGDAATFYSIYGMLNDKTTITALNPERVFVDQLNSKNVKFLQLIEKQNIPLLPSSKLTFFQNLGNKINAKFRPLTLQYREVDDTQIQHLKLEHSSDVFLSSVGSCFVSTNDILISKLSTHNSLVYIAMNLRSKIEEYANKTGNYICGLSFTSEEHSSIVAVRNALNRKLNYATVNCGPMSEITVDELVNKQVNQDLEVPAKHSHDRFTLISNWSSFHEQVEFEGMRTLVHFPILLRDRQDPNMDAIIVIFKSKPETLAVRTDSRWHEKPSPILKTEPLKLFFEF